MKKIHPLVMLPVEKAIKCLLLRRDGFLTATDIEETKETMGEHFDGYKFHHLYVISDDKPKVGDWVIEYQMGDILGTVQMIRSEYELAPDIQKKIIATTDVFLTMSDKGSSLLNESSYGVNGKKGIFDLPQLSESFIQAYIKSYNEGKPIVNVMVEYENYGYCGACRAAGMWHCAHADTCGNSQTLERPKIRPDNTIIIHTTKQIKHDEMLLNMQYYMEYVQMNGYITPQNWLDTYKHF